jgi:twinkle protein
VTDESYAIAKEPCPACGSRDNLVRYSDGHAYCFGMGCSYYEPATDSETDEPIVTPHRRQVLDLIEPGQFIALTKRGLTEETCRRAGYSVSSYHGQAVQVAAIKDPQTGETLGQKVRFPNKDFKYLGETKDDPFFMQHLWKDGGKRVVITEGEIDALTVFQVQQYKWPVVSITKGIKAAKRQIQQNLLWLDKFDEVVLMFDMDEPGRAGAIESAAVFKPGRCKIAHLSMKDANELHQAGKDDEIVTAIWNAKSYRPDGIVTLAELRERILAEPENGFPWWDDRLTNLTFGRRLGETYAFGAGTGVGKTDWFTEQMQFDMTHLNQPIAVFALEQQPDETGKRLAGKYAGKRFHIPKEAGGWTQDELVSALDTLEASGKVFFYDNFGATDWDVIQTTIRFLAHSEGVKLFYLDHLTALAAAEDDELGALKRIMSEMAELAKELKIIIHFISHLSRPKEGKPHEEGGRVMIKHFYGSSSIGFWSHFMFGLERDQQNENEALRGITTFRVLKDRYTGNATGKCIHYGYDAEIGRLFATDKPDEDAEHPFSKPEGSNTDF